MDIATAIAVPGMEPVTLGMQAPTALPNVAAPVPDAPKVAAPTAMPTFAPYDSKQFSSSSPGGKGPRERKAPPVRRSDLISPRIHSREMRNADYGVSPNATFTPLTTGEELEKRATKTGYSGRSARPERPAKYSSGSRPQDAQQGSSRASSLKAAQAAAPIDDSGSGLPISGLGSLASGAGSAPEEVPVAPAAPAVHGADLQGANPEEVAAPTTEVTDAASEAESADSGATSEAATLESEAQSAESAGPQATNEVPVVPAGPDASSPYATTASLVRAVGSGRYAVGDLVGAASPGELAASPVTAPDTGDRRNGGSGMYITPPVAQEEAIPGQVVPAETVADPTDVPGDESTATNKSIPQAESIPSKAENVPAESKSLPNSKPELPTKGAQGAAERLPAGATGKNASSLPGEAESAAAAPSNGDTDRAALPEPAIPEGSANTKSAQERKEEKKQQQLKGKGSSSSASAVPDPVDPAAAGGLPV
ncbi:hypothetical protein EIP91_007553 [Steccherinum ochraceum]|uniref:Uncharacterized protein n=1 Tax=Steccherinum ochraceum TaxID=92696 RepID=A0A4R0R9T5_9APHY|nr:hypothetical protein EIP91_007553 [Steccherinum ochraceum]